MVALAPRWSRALSLHEAPRLSLSVRQSLRINLEKRLRDEDSVKASATVREAVTDAENEISQEEAAKACPRLARPRTRQDGSAEQPHVCQRSADVRPRNQRVRRVVLFRAAPCVQSSSGSPLSHSPAA